MDPAATPADTPSDEAASALTEARQLARQRRRASYLAATLATLAIVSSIAWLVNVVTTERTLHAVTSAALPALPRPPAATPAPAPVESPVPPAPAIAAAAAGTAALAAAALPAPQPAPPPEPPAVTKPAAGQLAQATLPAAKAHTNGKRLGVRRAVKRMADSATFRRCPPLGQAGAVMCRWHICNGGAGKEAACRPYLERQP